MGSGKTSNKFNKEFRQMIVELYQSGTPVKDLSSEYGVSETTIYKWIKKLNPISLEDGKSFTPVDYLKLQKEMRRIQEENEILKKGYGHIRKKVTSAEMSVLIDRLQEKHPIKTVCQVLDMPRSTYYQAKSAGESSLARENRKLMQRIQTLYTESKRRYGAPKIQKRLRKEGFMVSLKRVQQLMRRANLRSIIVKKYRPQSSQGPVENRKNVLAQDFTTTKINQKWVADITYIHTIKEGWCYLASVMDLCTRKIIGYSFSRSMTTELALKALDNACVNQNPEPGLILHTDLGSQYTSHEFEKAIQEKQIVHSFSKKGCPYDNACIESFHATLKKEEIHQTTYHDFNEARRALFQYIEGWYNRSRIHSCLDYLTPQEAEDKFLKVA
ncbi:IS3 family transposase [Terrilactibacillus sp. BCM23-1]|uniref:IS3 family transposase n=1 Tax=Terrilactibacillus tamarindi TaxID=2599694 RepID=A0A6N8CND2_9BACI|nr:IS3 family transposase [Terrilactibacillus tamarindi]MTT31634.1 IS3 family transposase [Terrilactibacillus tamarindi]